MSVLLPKVEGSTPDALYDWAKRIIVYFERGGEAVPFEGLPALSRAADPAAVDLGVGNWSVFKNTVSGNVYLAYNDAGTIKKVQLT